MSAETVGLPGLPLELPPLPVRAHPLHNLPVPPTPLLGREREVAVLWEWLRGDAIRLLTLTGPGGTGKTRLGLQVAAELLDTFADGVWFVDLAPLRDPGLLASAVAQVLRVHEAGERGLLESLKQHLREKQILLLIDNFEHLLVAAPLVAELLAAAPRLKVLVTSRAVLRLRGEQEYPVEPLPAPDPRRLPPVEALLQYAAVELFLQRAVNARPDFDLTRENAPAVAAICHRLDGLPLAIELAAARIKLFPPEALLARLGSRLSLLTVGARDAPARQQTLRDAITWSYDLLAEGERALLRLLSVFVSGCTLEAVEAVCRREGERSGDLLERVAALVDKSLLRQVGQGKASPERAADGPRLGMLETIREFAAESLSASGETDLVREQHASHFVAWAERPHTLDELAIEHDNMLAALDWLVERGDGESALRLGSVLERLWYRGYDWTVGRQRLEWLLAAPCSQRRTRLRSELLRTVSLLSALQGDQEKAFSYDKERLALCRELGDRAGIAETIGYLGTGARDKGDYSRARTLLEESLSMFQELGDKERINYTLNALGFVDRFQADYSAARLRFEESLARAREIGHQDGIVIALWNLVVVARLQGDRQRAAALLQETLTRAREMGNQWILANAILNAGHLSFHGGDAVPAARLFAAALAVRDSLGARWLPCDREECDRNVAASRRILGEEAFAAARAEGRAMPLDEAVTYALNVILSGETA